MNHMVGNDLGDALCGARVPQGGEPSTGDRATYIRDKVTCVPCLSRMPDGFEIYEQQHSDYRRLSQAVAEFRRACDVTFVQPVQRLIARLNGGNESGDDR